MELINCLLKRRMCMDNIQSNNCNICRDFGTPYAVGYIEANIIVCGCGNLVKIVNHPAIYIGNIKNIHVMIIPFPGCTVCGRETNTPVSFPILCMDENNRYDKMREVYHNYGSRN